MLIKKNIIITKKIILNRETKIIEKTDRTIIKSKKKSISISARYLSGSINNLMNDVKIIINKWIVDKTLFKISLKSFKICKLYLAIRTGIS